MPFADLHCHPAFWSFNRVKLDDANDPENHIWNIHYTKKDLRRMRKGKRASYAQADFNTLTQGDVKLVFASLYAMEKGFFMGNKVTKIHADAVGGVLNQLIISWPGGIRKFIGKLLWPLNKVFALIVNNEGWGRDVVQRMVMGFSRDRINRIQSDTYDYFTELQREHAFYAAFEDKNPTAPALPTTLRYDLATDGTDVANIIDVQKKIAVVFSIEGFHCLCLKPHAAGDDGLQLCDEPEIFSRIDLVKNTWKVFFITFSHHFSNHVAGHANSLPKLLQEIADPHPLKNDGFVDVLAEKYIRRILGISPENTRIAEERRVLIDVKHFSARSRNDYYTRIIRPYNTANPGDKIPVVASHCGYYGPVNELPVVNLQYLVDHAHGEEDDSFEGNFYRWNINLCDEDIREIVDSGGLIGVSFDQRILGRKRTKKVSVEEATFIVSRNILGIVTSARHNVTDQPHRVWQCMTIGTDFDGLIDPVDHFQTTSHFGTFKTEFLSHLDELGAEKRALLFVEGNPFTPAQVADMICYTNALNFTINHFK